MSQSWHLFVQQDWPKPGPESEDERLMPDPGQGKRQIRGQTKSQTQRRIQECWLPRLAYQGLHDFRMQWVSQQSGCQNSFQAGVYSARALIICLPGT